MVMKVVTPENLGYFKVKQDAYNEGKFAKKGDIAAVMRFKGSCAFAGLPAGAQVGDVWNVTDKGGMNYAWTGTAWDELGGEVELSWDAITGKPSSYAPASHTHTKSQITDFPASLKNPSALSIQLNGGAATSYDGSEAKSINVTASSVGAAAASHTHPAMGAASSSAAGSAGLVPAPAAGAANRYLRSDGTWAVPPDTNTTYANMKAATASAAGAAGLVPAPAAGAQAKYLRGDGTWQTPPDTNTTYSAATQSAAGLMSAADKAKLDGISSGATQVSAMTDAEVDALFA